MVQVVAHRPNLPDVEFGSGPVRHHDSSNGRCLTRSLVGQGLLGQGLALLAGSRQTGPSAAKGRVSGIEELKFAGRLKPVAKRDAVVSDSDRVTVGQAME